MLAKKSRMRRLLLLSSVVGLLIALAALLTKTTATKYLDSRGPIVSGSVAAPNVSLAAAQQANPVASVQDIPKFGHSAFQAYGYAENNPFGRYCPKEKTMRFLADAGSPATDAQSMEWREQRLQDESKFRRNPQEGFGLLLTCLYQRDNECVERVLTQVCPPGSE